jgi:hypothetical protein
MLHVFTFNILLIHGYIISPANSNLQHTGTYSKKEIKRTVLLPEKKITYIYF